MKRPDEVNPVKNRLFFVFTDLAGLAARHVRFHRVKTGVDVSVMCRAGIFTADVGSHDRVGRARVFTGHGVLHDSDIFAGPVIRCDGLIARHPFISAAAGIENPCSRFATGNQHQTSNRNRHRFPQPHRIVASAFKTRRDYGNSHAARYHVPGNEVR